MGKGNRFTEEFRVEAVKQVTERGFAVKDVSQRLGVSPHSLYEWIKRYGIPKPSEASRKPNTLW
jgi:transposase